MQNSKLTYVILNPCRTLCRRTFSLIQDLVSRRSRNEFGMTPCVTFNSRRRQAGFTLIELIVVMGVFGIIAAAMVATVNPAEQFRKSNDARRKSDLSQIQRSLETYYEDNKRYPESSSEYEISPGGTAIQWGTQWQPYMNILPKETASNKRYVYYVPDASGQKYYIYANLDRGAKDSQACNGGNTCINVPTNPSEVYCSITGNLKCNYGVSSPNTQP